MELTIVEEDRFKSLENTIERGLKVFYEVGEALAEIKDSKFYRFEGYENFEAYVIGRWGMKANYARRLITSSNVIENIAESVPIGTDLPQTESQTRELAKAPEEDQAPIWDLATSATEVPTAKEVASARETYEDVKEEMPEATEEVILEVAKGKRAPMVTLNTGDNEWYTPSEYVESARAVMGSIDVDPASNPLANEKVKADTYYTIDTNGLDKEWTGNVWLNPPYSNPLIRHFIEKMIESWKSGIMKAGILLTNNSTDTIWFHLVANECTAMCLTKGRIKFYKNEDNIASPTNGQVFYYFGEDIEAFKNEFSQHGLIIVKA